MQLSLRSSRPEDRLATAPFVAALLHGLLILGLRFTAPTSDERPLPTPEVLLVPEGELEDPNPESSYIADRDQRGSGNTRERLRTSLPEASAQDSRALGRHPWHGVHGPFGVQRPGRVAHGGERRRTRPSRAGRDRRAHAPADPMR